MYLQAKHVCGSRRDLTKCLLMRTLVTVLVASLFCAREIFGLSLYRGPSPADLFRLLIHGFTAIFRQNSQLDVLFAFGIIARTIHPVTF